MSIIFVDNDENEQYRYTHGVSTFARCPLCMEISARRRRAVTQPIGSLVSLPVYWHEVSDVHPASLTW